jgi:hypothetical protein
MAIPKAQALIAGSRKTKKGIVPVMNRQNGFGVVGGHGYLWNLQWSTHMLNMPNDKREH